MKKRILIIDDDKWLAELVKKFMNFEKFIVDSMYEFSSSEEIISKASAESYNCILIDYMLGCCTGIELAKQLRQKDHFCQVPFILVTTMFVTPQLSTDLLAINMKYLKKPFTKADLIKIIFEAMSVDHEEGKPSH